MTATLDDVTKRIKREPTAEEAAAEEMVRRAREQGLSLTGPDGLLKQLTKTVLETAVNQELTEHLGHEKNGRPDPDSGNVRNGTRPKTVLTESTGQVQIGVPRDRAGTFEPQIVKKRQRRLSGVDEIVLSLYAKGLTTGEISAHFEQIYDASVSKETISRITGKVIEEMAAWQNRPLDAVYAAIFLDAIMVKVRDGQVASRPVYAAIGVTLEGHKDILGLWAGTGGEGAKFWMAVLTDLRNRGVRDVFFLVCDGLKGLPEVVGSVWPLTIVQTCIIHLIRHTFRLASKRDWDAIKRGIKPIYTAIVNAILYVNRAGCAPLASLHILPADSVLDPACSGVDAVAHRTTDLARPGNAPTAGGAAGVGDGDGEESQRVSPRAAPEIRWSTQRACRVGPGPLGN
jgi:putative transposase